MPAALSFDAHRETWLLHYPILSQFYCAAVSPARSIAEVIAVIFWLFPAAGSLLGSKGFPEQFEGVAHPLLNKEQETTSP